MEMFQDDFIKNFCIGANVKHPEKIAINITMNNITAPCNVIAGINTRQTNMRNGVNYNLIVTEYDKNRLTFLKKIIEQIIAECDN